MSHLKSALSLLIVSSIVSAKEQGIELKMTEVISTKISPSLLAGSIRVEDSAPTQEQVRNKLESILQTVKIINKEKLCTGGSYSSYPQDEWQNGKRIRKGYNGSISFDCKVKTVDEYDRIANAINLSASKTARISQSQLAWVSDENAVKASTDEMQMKLIETATEKAGQIASKFDWLCKVKDINFNGNYPIAKPYARNLNSMASMSLENNSQESISPIYQDIDHSMSANITIFCKRGSYCKPGFLYDAKEDVKPQTPKMCKED